MAILKRQEESADETSSSTYTVSLPPSFAPLASRTVVPVNTATDTYNLPSFAPIAKMTAEPTPTANANIPYLPSFAPLASRERVSVSTPVWPTSTPTTSPLSAQAKTNSSLSGGKIAGIVVGSVAGLCLLTYMVYVLFWSRRKIAKQSKHNKPRNEDIDDEKPKRESLYDNNKYSNNGVNTSSPTEVLYDDLFSEIPEKDYVSDNNNTPSALPRLAKRYDPNRVYSTTSSTSDLREDFRSYYKARGSFQSGSNGSSGSSSADSGTPLFGGRSLLYGAATPYYGPVIQQQSPAAFSNRNFNLPMYAPQFIPPSMNSMDYYLQPAFIPPSPTNNLNQT